jgi:HAD superfamily hydrolase (TIGR01662 family)
MSIKLVILDRDGTINVDSDEFIKSPDEWHPIEGALEAIGRLNHAGYHVVVATNQSGLGRGLMDVASLNAIHAQMNKEHRCHFLLSARPRRSLPVPQTRAGPARTNRRALWHHAGRRALCRRQFARHASGAGQWLPAAPGADRQGHGLARSHAAG